MTTEASPEGEARRSPKDGSGAYAVYPYHDEQGALLYEVVRRPPKWFVQRRPNGNGGFIYDLDGIEPVLYRLPELLKGSAAGEPVFLVEGEKDADRLAELGLVATTSSRGAGPKWDERLAACFTGASVVYVIADNDPPGRKAARERAELVARKVSDVRLIMKLPSAGEDDGFDVSDFLDAGYDVARLWEIADAGDQVMPAEGATPPDAGESDRKGAGEASRIISELLTLEEMGQAEFFADELGKPWLHISLSGGGSQTHWETIRIDSRLFPGWLGGRFYKEHGKTIPDRTKKEIAETIAAHAIYERPQRDVSLRIAGADGKIYLDLADEQRTVVEISCGRWRVLSPDGKPPARFFRPRGFGALPMPTPSGSLDELNELLTLRPEELLLVQAWLIGIMRPTPPYLPLELTGEQGSGKSTIATMLCRLVDPGRRGSSLPASERDLAVAGRNHYVLVYDNLSGMPPAISDALCRLADGAGFAVRENFTDDEETVFPGGRPIIMTGINRVASNPDLVDRVIRAEVPVLKEELRRDPAEIDRCFEEARPRLLGALLDATAAGLASTGRDAPHGLGRNPGWSRFVLAGARGAGLDAPALETALRLARSEGKQDVIERSPLGRAVRELFDAKGPRVYTPTELYEELTCRCRDESGNAPKGWPPDVARMGRVLRQLAPALREVGVPIEMDRPGRQREIVLGEPSADESA
ncbi:MAG: hypothetical protein ACYCST_07140 [Acidimicrobiales bacterium]